MQIPPRPSRWLRRIVACLAATISVAHLGTAGASTGLCDSNPPTTTEACIQAVQASGGVVNDIFRDSQGRTVDQLPLTGKVVDIFPQCARMNSAGCNPGISKPPYDCPGQYACTDVSGANPADVAHLGVGLNAIDHQWGHPCRLANGPLPDGCPDYSTCVSDGVVGHYNPWEGIVFDLGGPSNRVAIFAENDHGPQPCESLEYTIFLTDNPQSQEVVLQPTTTGADPQKWNRAVLSKVFTKGFVEVRAPDQAGHGASCGDTDLYSVEEDSFVQVFSLPCGITFRYAAVVAGNDGLDFPACAFDSSEAELDGVVGLTEEGAGVCPDADKDGFVDCNCPGAPAVCDCNDADAAVHPGASEKCDDSDRNCDGAPGACGSGLVCFASVCVPTCNASGEFSMCPPGSSCEATDAGKLCVPKDCSAGGCPAGSVCDVASGACRPACDGVVCPHGQVCRDGACADPCTGVVCPNQQVCEDGSCRPRCACFQADVGCPTGLVCDRTGESACVTTDCQNVTCAAPQFCDMGQCVSPCTGATCPIGQKCEDATGACVPKCQGVTCASGETCEPATGQCVSDGECNCLPPSVCVGGTCVVPDGGAPSDAGAEDASAGDDGGGPHRGPQTADEADADSGGGCGCRVAPSRSASRGGLAAAALLLAALGRRRRRGAA